MGVASRECFWGLRSAVGLQWRFRGEIGRTRETHPRRQSATRCPEFDGGNILVAKRDSNSRSDGRPATPYTCILKRCWFLDANETHVLITLRNRDATGHSLVLDIAAGVALDGEVAFDTRHDNVSAAVF